MACHREERHQPTGPEPLQSILHGVHDINAFPSWRVLVHTRSDGTAEELILKHEPIVRLGAFLLVFLAVAAAEPLAPRRRLTTSKGRRWGRNLAIVVLNTLVLRALAALVPVAAVAMAVSGSRSGFGLLNALALPIPVAIVLGIVALDFAIYLQHVLFHAVPLLWRLHKVHHADLDFDVTTGARFHPIEIVVSLAIKLAAVAVIGPPAVAVVIFEVLLNATSMFNHGNVKLPRSLDRVLRVVFVTPDMHRVHHSVVPGETNSNFGFNLTWWDRLFGTYRAQPEAGHEAMQIGLAEHRDPASVTLGRILVMPFARSTPPPAAPTRELEPVGADHE